MWAYVSFITGSLCMQHACGRVINHPDGQSKQHSDPTQTDPTAPLDSLWAHNPPDVTISPSSAWHTNTLAADMLCGCDWLLNFCLYVNPSVYDGATICRRTQFITSIAIIRRNIHSRKPLTYFHQFTKKNEKENVVLGILNVNSHIKSTEDLLF